MHAHAKAVGTLMAALLLLAGLLLPSSAQAAAGQRLDLRILVIGGGDWDPTTNAWTSELTRQGIPFDIVRRGVDTSAPLPPLVNPDDPTHGHYNGIVLSTHASLLGDLAPVYGYERDFGVRQISGYEFPNPDVGLRYSGDNIAGPFTAQLTAAGKGAFNYLAGPVPLDEGAMAYDSFDANADYANFTPEAWTGEPLSPNFTPYILTPTSVRGKAVKGRIIGGFYTHTGQDPVADRKAGVQEVVLTFNYNATMMQWRLLAPGLIRWVTRGVHIGHNRNYLSNHVDDIFMADDLWSVEHHCTPAATDPVDPLCPAGVGGDPDGPTVRMTAEDVAKVVNWQRAHGFRLDMAFNAVDAVAGDPLTSALLKNKGAFDWMNHTWSHPFLGCRAYNTAGDPQSGCAVWPSVEEIESEIVKNINYAAAKRLPRFHESTLVTGEHSGLDNPNLPAALEGLVATGPDGETWTVDITSIAADNSRQPTQYQIGPARTVPRHPSNIYYNVATWEQLVDEYNTLYVKPESGGKCVDVPNVTTCRDVPATKQEILDSESAIVMRNLLSNDPRPGYSHQSNLAGDQVILGLLGDVITRYNSYFASNAPIVMPQQAAAGAELQRQDAWRAAVRDKQVTAYVMDGVVTITSTAGVRVPLTLPVGSTVGTGTTLFGASYAGAQSAWVSVQRGTPYTAKVGA